MHPMRRSASGLTTLTTLNRRSTKYKYYIGVITVFLIITSTIVMFTAISLIEFYMMPHLKFWGDLFVVAPYLMLGVGIYTFVVNFCGFFISASGNRLLLIIFAVLLSVACLTQLASVYMFWKIKLIIEEPERGLIDGKSQLEYYWTPGYENVTDSWDEMQEHLHCCGVENFRDWQGKNPRGSLDIPDSCCQDKSKGCGKDKLDTYKGRNAQIYDDIYTLGCFVILKDWMETKVENIINIYTGVGVVTAIIELVAIALVFAYSAQINRKRAREERIHLDKRFPTSPGFNSNGEILLETEYDPKPEYDSSKHESEI